MNSLEFIEKEIATTKKDISIWKVGTETKKYLKEKLQTLEQIKSELEAWETTKRELALEIIEHYNDIFKTKYALKCDYQGLIPLIDKEVESFKKALEVK